MDKADRMHADGKADGAGWARTDAKTGDLKRLAREVRATDARGYGNGDGTPSSFVELSASGNSHGLASNLFEALFGDGRPSASEMADFWENVIDLGRGWAKTVENTDYASGFVEGCLEELDRRTGEAKCDEFSAGLMS